MPATRALPPVYAHRALLALAIVAAAGLWWHGPIAQDPDYHRFADTRTLFRISNFANVVSNAAFLLAGLWGLWRLRGGSWQTPWIAAYRFMLIGLTLAAFGSTYYHLLPSDGRLFWDRLPLGMVFMGLAVGQWFERVAVPSRWPLWLVALIAAGLGSVLYWRLTGDLRPYALVQFLPFAALPVLWIMTEERFVRGRGCWGMVLCYAIAKICELQDREIFMALGVSGHTLKHLFAAVGVALFAGAMPKVSAIKLPPESRI